MDFQKFRLPSLPAVVVALTDDGCGCVVKKRKECMPKRRIDTNPDRQPLSANPFASLEGLAKEGLPQGEEPKAPMPAAPKACAPYAVARTRKGGMPVSLENRPGGKVVTVVGNVSGDAAALLNLLKHRCGAGGAVRGEVIEIQGDHRERITTLLRDALR